jgi:hypothetical protein
MSSSSSNLQLPSETVRYTSGTTILQHALLTSCSLLRSLSPSRPMIFLMTSSHVSKRVAASFPSDDACDYSMIALEFVWVGIGI